MAFIPPTGQPRRPVILTWWLLVIAVPVCYEAAHCDAVHANAKRFDRSEFDTAVADWKQDNPHLAGSLDEHDFLNIWTQISGEAEAKPILAGPINPYPSEDAPPSLASASDDDIAKARQVVAATIKRASQYNREHTVIHRNSYMLKPEERTKTRAAAPNFIPNQEEKKAAALVAEADARELQRNGTLHRQYDIPIFGEDLQPTFQTHRHSELSTRDSGYWLAQLGAQYPGNFPFGGDAKYKVFRNVKDYGAKGDGVSDDTFAIFFAMYDGSRCGSGCGGTTVKAHGLYSRLTTAKRDLPGDPKELPVIPAAASFTGLGVFSSDVYIPDGNGETWYLNTANFLRQIRNFIIDTKDVKVDDLKVLHWQVAQATSLQNVHIKMRQGSNHIGLFIENGSGGTLDSISVDGGFIGINCGNQQFTSKNIVVTNSNVAISMLWDWGWTWQGLYLLGNKYGIQFKTSDFIGGSLIVLDSFFLNVEIGISIDQAKDAVSLTVKNLQYVGVKTLIEGKASGSVLAGGSGTLDNWILGTAYQAPDYKQEKINGGSSAAATVPNTPGLFTKGGRYFIRAKPQYGDIAADQFYHTAMYTSKNLGDGKTDATAVLSFLALLSASARRPLFIPTGSYIITDTVNIPAGAKIVGACWSQLVASGEKFADMNNPRPMIRVGDSNKLGSVEISDILFTVKGPTAGAVLVEWNIAAAEQGSAAMWDSHFRVGGAQGSDLQKGQCPKMTGAVNSKCIASSLLLHLTKNSDAYLDNIWAWTADHDLDDPPKSETQIDIYSARGILIESVTPTWLYGTSSEHNVLYQYSLANAANIFMGMIQTESPYYLPHPPAPKPFESAVGRFASDPDFKDCKDDSCRVSWALTAAASRAKAASRGFLYTIGSKEMVSQGGLPSVMAKDNLKINQDPFVSIIAAYSKRQGNFLGDGGIFFEGGPDGLGFGNCKSPSPGYLKLLDWFFRERFEPIDDQNGYADTWESQLFGLLADQPSKRCDSIYPTKANYANAYWLMQTLENYYFDLRAQKSIITDIFVAQGPSIGERIAKDFPATEPDAKDGLSKAFEAISKAIGIGSWAFEKSKRAQSVGGHLGDFGTIFDFITGFIKDDKEDEKPDIKSVVDRAMTNLTTIIQANSIQTAIDFFALNSNITQWRKSVFPQNQPYEHIVSNFLADGRYTFGVGGRQDQDFYKRAKDRILSSLVAMALIAEDYYIIADFYYKPDCNPDGVKDGAKFPTARWIGNHCYALHKPGIGWQGAEVTDRGQYSVEIGQDKVDRFTDYAFDVEAVYRSSINCQERYNAYDHNMPQDDFNNALVGDDDPIFGSCLYSLPVLYVDPAPHAVTDQSPCLMVDGTGGKAGHDYLPPQLKKKFGERRFCNSACEGKACTCPGCSRTVNLTRRHET